MSQVSKYPISKNVSDRIFEIFLSTFTKIKDRKEADQFLSDFLTPTEKVMLAKRLAIAFLLEKNYDYRTIQKVIKVSTGTITSVNTTRQHGSNGYKKLLEKILREENLLKLLDSAISHVLTATSALERGKGTWSYLKRKAQKGKQKKAF